MLDELFQLSRVYLREHQFSHRRSEFQSKGFLAHRLSILAGPRGVGKTTLIIQTLLKYVDNNLFSKAILYVPSDHFLIAQTSLYEIASQFVQEGGQWIAFDEIHKYPNWSQELKSIYETFPRLIVVVSGSSLIELHKGSHDLTRRSVVYKLNGLSLREYISLIFNIRIESVTLEQILKRHDEISHEIVSNLSKYNQAILPIFKQYLKQGYYPYFLELGDLDTYYLTIEQNIIATIETDIPAVYPSLTGHSLRKIKHILGFLSANVPFKPSYKQLQLAADVTDLRTLKTYLKYLEDAHLIRQLLPAGSKFGVLEAAEKLYLHNPNQYYALSIEPNIGTVRELFFLCALQQKQLIASPKAGDFLVNESVLFEIGGRKKDYSQLKNHPCGYLACDDIEIGVGRRIPLWLFGFLD